MSDEADLRRRFPDVSEATFRRLVLALLTEIRDAQPETHSSPEYVVFRRSDILPAYAESVDFQEALELYALDDAIVIRQAEAESR